MAKLAITMELACLFSMTSVTSTSKMASILTRQFTTKSTIVATVMVPIMVTLPITMVSIRRLPRIEKNRDRVCTKDDKF